jgi:hypothetical protein
MTIGKIAAVIILTAISVRADNCTPRHKVIESAKWYEANARVSLDLLVYNIERDTMPPPEAIAHD